MGERGEKFVAFLISLWPAVIGLGGIGIGLMMILSSENPTGRRDARAALLFIGIGVAALGYWALANKSDDYNF